jgi:MFS family permease
MWCDPMVIGVALVGSTAYWVTSFSVAWLSPLVRLGLGFDAETAGWIVFAVYFANAASLLTFSFLFEAAVARQISSRRAVVLPVIGCLAVGAAALASVGIAGQPTLQLVLLGLGVALMLPVAGAMPLLLSEIAPPRHRNRMLVVVLSSTSLTGMVAPYVAGLLIGDGGMDGYVAALDITAIVVASGAALAALLLHPQAASRRLAHLAALDERQDVAG